MNNFMHQIHLSPLTRNETLASLDDYDDQIDVFKEEEKNAPQTEEEIQEYAMELRGYISHEKIDIIGCFTYAIKAVCMTFLIMLYLVAAAGETHGQSQSAYIQVAHIGFTNLPIYPYKNIL
ncbi:hypothetical protein ACJX0J_026483, partial [Zea mays]